MSAFWRGFGRGLVLTNRWAAPLAAVAVVALSGQWGTALVFLAAGALAWATRLP